MSRQQGLIAPSEIAEMAGVSRAAVSNWRATERGSDFPEPAGGSEAKPLFDLAEVTAWLEAHNYTITRDHGGRLIWSTLNRYRGQWPVEALSDTLMSVLTARKLAIESAALSTIWASVPQTGHDRVAAKLMALGDAAGRERASWSDLIEFPTNADRQGTLVTDIYYAVNSLDPANLSLVADYVLSRVTAAQARSAGEFGLVGSRVARLLSQLAPGSGAGVVYDPACGIAETLIKVHSLDPSARLVGHDINPSALRLARQRCLLAEVDATFVLSNVLIQDPDPTFKADLILAEPPFGLRWDAHYAMADPRWTFGLPPKSSSDLLWVQHAIHHLEPGGRAYVVTSTGPLFRSAERKIRANLLNEGCIDAVIGLPGKLLPHTSIPLALWVLCRPGESREPDSVLLVDAAQELEPEEHIRDWLTVEYASGTNKTPPHARVSIRELLSNDARLQPQLWVGQAETDTAAIASRYRDAIETLAATSTNLERQAHWSKKSINFSTPRLVTVKELAQQGSASLYQGRAMSSAGADAGANLVSPRDVRDGLRSLDQPSERSAKPAAKLGPMTEPGDVLITTMNEIRTTVDPQGGRQLANGVHALRLDQTQCDPTYIAYCLTGSWNDRHQVGTTIKRADVRELEIPLIPLAEQRDAVAMLEAADHVRQHAKILAEAAQNLTATLLDIIRHDVSVPTKNAGTNENP